MMMASNVKGWSFQASRVAKQFRNSIAFYRFGSAESFQHRPITRCLTHGPMPAFSASRRCCYWPSIPLTLSMSRAAVPFNVSSSALAAAESRAVALTPPAYTV